MLDRRALSSVYMNGGKDLAPNGGREKERGAAGKSTYVPALGHDYAEEEEDEESAGCGPSVCGERGGFVEVGLVELYGLISDTIFQIKI